MGPDMETPMVDDVMDITIPSGGLEDSHAYHHTFLIGMVHHWEDFDNNIRWCVVI